MAWSTKPNMLVAIARPASCGSRTSCLSIGGLTKQGVFPYAHDPVRDCYIWNGTSWATFPHSIFPSGNLPTVSAWQAVGTVSDALLFGGMNQAGIYGAQNKTYKYVGAAWQTTTSNDMLSVYCHGMIGHPGKALGVYGSNDTHIWTGSVWVTGPNYTYAAGITDSFAWGYGACWGNGGNGEGYICGGQAPGQGPPIDYVSYFNGSSWISKTSMGYNRKGTSAGAGSLTDGLSWGGVTADGMPSKPSHAEYFNGSTWSVVSDANHGRAWHAGVGVSGISAITWGGEGNNPNGGGTYAYELSCEQYLEGFPFNISGVITENELPVQRNIKSYERNSGELFQETYSSGVDGSYNLGTENDTDEFYVVSFGRSGLSSWRISPSLNQANRSFAGYCGSNNDALVYGGYGASGPLNITEKWNGSSWSTTSNMLENKEISGEGAGTVVSALQCGGRTNRSSPNNRGSDTTEYWNGSTWSMSANMNQIKYQLTMCGDSSDALVSGGRLYDTTALAWYELKVCERFNGATWSTTASMNDERRIPNSCGLASDALVAGGYYSGNYLNKCEKFNGSSWTTTTNLPQVRGAAGLVGTSTDAVIIAGSNSGGRLTSCYKFNGSSWSSTDSINQVRNVQASMGERGEALIAGGYDGSNALDSCEIWSDSTPLPRFNALVWDRVTAEPAP